MPSKSGAAQAVIAVLFASMSAGAVAQTYQTTPPSPPLPSTASAEQSKCTMQNFATLALRDDGLTLSADGRINSDKAPVLIDSGAQNTMVTRTEVVKLGLSQPAAAGKGKKTDEDHRVQLSEFAIGAIELGNARILASPKLGDYANFGALIGADFLMQHDMELSIAAHRLLFFNPVGCDKSFLGYWDNNAAMVPLATLSATDHRPVVNVEVDGQTLRALVDTGTPISVISLAAAARAGVTPKSAGVTPMKGAAPGTHPSSWVAHFHKFSIGGEEIKNLKMPMLDLKSVVNAETGAATPDMILGEDFLRAHRVLFSISQQSFYFSYIGGSVFNMDVAAAGSSAPGDRAAPLKQ